MKHIQSVTSIRLRTSNPRQFVVAALATLAFVCAAPALASPYLVGFEVYSAQSDGTAINDPYFYTTNPNPSAARETIAPSGGSAESTSISFPLFPGDNVFGFAPTTLNTDPGDFAGIELFFNTDGTSFNPDSAGFAPDLAGYASTDGGSLIIPAAGTDVIDYGNSFGPTIPYDGATSVTIGSAQITLTTLSIGHKPSGSFTINVAVPEPAGISAIFLLPSLLLSRSRRPRKI